MARPSSRKRRTGHLPTWCKHGFRLLKIIADGDEERLSGQTVFLHLVTQKIICCRLRGRHNVRWHGWQKCVFIQILDPKENWGFLSDKLWHGLERKHIFCCVSVPALSLQSRFRDQMRLPQFPAYFSCASFRKLDVALRIKRISIRKNGSEKIHKASVGANAPWNLVGPEAVKMASRWFKAWMVFLSTNETHRRLSAFQWSTAARCRRAQICIPHLVAPCAGFWE